MRVERGAVAVTERAVTVDGKPVLVLPRPPTHWAAAPGGASTRTAVMTGVAREGAVGAAEIVGARELALLFPVPHRTVFRVALTPAGTTTTTEVDLTRLADADSVRRGWARQLDRALRTELPDTVQWCVDVARATVLMEGAMVARPRRRSRPRSKTGASTTRRARCGRGSVCATGAGRVVGCRKPNHGRGFEPWSTPRGTR